MLSKYEISIWTDANKMDPAACRANGWIVLALLPTHSVIAMLVLNFETAFVANQTTNICSLGRGWFEFAHFPDFADEISSSNSVTSSCL